MFTVMLMRVMQVAVDMNYHIKYTPIHNIKAHIVPQFVIKLSYFLFKFDRGGGVNRSRCG